MARVGEAVAAGDRDTTRARLEALWAEIGGGRGDALHQLAIAHAMADAQSDPREELAWDLLALQAADNVTDARVAGAGMPGPAAALYPSLHLNVGDDYRRLGDLDEAQRHASLGLQAAAGLGEDGYSQMIRAGLQRLNDRLAVPPASPR